jgi:ribosome-binding protein aMBF1 (putative translation factor)
MVELKHQYCKICKKNTNHALKTYYDGTIAQVCLECQQIELIRKGYDYRRFKKAVNKKSHHVYLFPLSI